MPRLWNETLEAHRRDVRNAILDTTATLVTEQGLRSVTMGQIAQRTGIGRATLYKYFPDVGAILAAWHRRHIDGHLQRLAAARDAPARPGQRLHAVLAAYAHVVHEMSQQHQSGELAAHVHRDEHVARAQRQLDALIRDVLTEAAQAGHARLDIAPEELAIYCLHALAAAASLQTADAVDRLVSLTLAGVQPPPSPLPARRETASTEQSDEAST